MILRHFCTIELHSRWPDRQSAGLSCVHVLMMVFVDTVTKGSDSLLTRPITVPHGSGHIPYFFLEYGFLIHPNLQGNVEGLRFAFKIQHCL